MSGLIIDPHNDLLPVGLIAQLVEHCTSVTEVRIWVPFRQEFFKPFFLNCLSSKAKLRRSLKLKFKTVIITVLNTNIFQIIISKEYTWICGEQNPYCICHNIHEYSHISGSQVVDIVASRVALHSTHRRMSTSLFSQPNCAQCKGDNDKGFANHVKG